MKEIFVFGSNREGRHGKGAALVARLKHGARYGYAEGRQGDSYAIVTKELRKYVNPVNLDEIRIGVDKFRLYANAHPELLFVVTPIGCGLAGFTPKEIAPLFHSMPENVQLPKEFLT